MKTDNIAVTLLASPHGEFELEYMIAGREDMTEKPVLVHWKSWREGAPHLNTYVREDHIEEDVKELLEDARVWIPEATHLEYWAKVVAAVRFLFATAELSRGVI